MQWIYNKGKRQADLIVKLSHGQKQEIKGYFKDEVENMLSNGYW